MTSNIHRPVCPNGPVFLGMPGANEPLSIRDNFFIKSSVAKMPNQTLKENGHCLISVGHAIDAFKQFPAHLKQGVWAAGTRTHQKLASHGYWVNANAEGLGQQIVEDLSHSLAVKEMRSTWNNQWYHFGPESNETSHPNEPTIQNISSYQREMLPLDQETIKQLNQCQCFYWTSFSQYKAYLKAVPSIANKMHCCGPGKTFDEFSNHQININLFISLEEFKQWTSAH
jgi:hydroxymethylbilane synthase